MKTHVITISKYYPKGHRREGELTDFETKIRDGKKIHTIRKVGKWPHRIKEVQEGKAVLSVREWTGIPYNSPQKELFRFTKDDGVGFELCEEDFGSMLLKAPYKSLDMYAVAENDGLTLKDYFSWFAKVVSGTEMIIIHFTPFRYQI